MSCDYEMAPECRNAKERLKNIIEHDRRMIEQQKQLAEWITSNTLPNIPATATIPTVDTSIGKDLWPEELKVIQQEIGRVEITKDAKTPQPPPTGNGKEVLPHVVRDLTARVEWGKEKYGTVLKTLNGRAALIDAYQEALDLVMYLKQELLEKEGVRMGKTIKEWQKETHSNAVNHGWYDGEQRKVPELLCLIHSEVSEALEAYREGKDDEFNEELADVAIRLFDMCEYLDVDLEQEVEKKHETNKARPYRHGNKRC